MANKNEKNEQQTDEEVVKVRHTITAEETFTLAKDVFDIRCFIKNVYANRAVIANRLNLLTLTISTVYMLLYSAYVLFTGLTQKLNFAFGIVLYVFLGVYGVLFVLFVTLSILSSRSSTKNVKKYKKVLKIFKLLVRLVSLAISITAIVLSKGESTNVVLDIIVIIFSVITLIFQVIPLFFGGLGKLARWLLSPVKIKQRFAKVVNEWYVLVDSQSSDSATVKKVSKKYVAEIGGVIDRYLLHDLGKKYITVITPAMLLNTVARADETDRPVLEGVLKNVFAYAAECSYVTFDPCKDLQFEGSVEEEVKPEKKTFKGKLLDVGKKIGKSVLDKYITGTSEKPDKPDKK